VVWTARRVKAWQQSGGRAAVAVWTTTQFAVFLRSVSGDRLYALWWLIGLRNECRKTLPADPAAAVRVGR
jgi:hypothetical protein